MNHAAIWHRDAVSGAGHYFEDLAKPLAEKPSSAVAVDASNDGQSLTVKFG